jgi:hypothetical protein
MSNGGERMRPNFTVNRTPARGLAASAEGLEIGPSVTRA